MGNVIPSGGSRHVKVMKLDGQILKFKAPITVEEIVQDHPNHVILHSEAVRHLGVRAKPLDGSTQLHTKQLYFIVSLPKLDQNRVPRRVSSGIMMSAKSRLESMLLARRSISDISMITSSAAPNDGNPTAPNDGNPTPSMSPGQGEDGSLRLKVRLPKAQLAKLMAETENSSEAAERILDLCFDNTEARQPAADDQEVPHRHSHSLLGKPALDSIPESCKKTQKNRVRFSSVQNGQVF